MSELLTVYEDYLKTEKHASANTVSSYVRDVHQFAQSMEDSGVSLTEVLPKDVEGFTKSLVRKGKSPATVTRSVASIKSFYNCLIALGKVARNPAKGVAPAKVERERPQILTGKEGELLLLGACAALGAAVYFLLAGLMRLEEMGLARDLMKRILKRG